MFSFSYHLQKYIQPRHESCFYPWGKAIIYQTPTQCFLKIKGFIVITAIIEEKSYISSLSKHKAPIITGLLKRKILYD